MYKLVEYSEDLDLKPLYKTALLEKALNNTSKQVMIDCFKNEKEFGAFVLYYNDVPMGFSAYHSLDIMGDRCYRICARNYVHNTANNTDSLHSPRKLMQEHQNVTAQFYIPKFIETLPESRLFITTNHSLVAKQRQVHSIYMPTLEKMGLVNKVAEVEYRGHDQTFWEVSSQDFLDSLNKYPRWA